ncbi:restriction endonuclease subunit S [Salegentibacter sp. Hel_I_6]|uniref:restriction endonuclease subunit S n=1 Tax=Salegentibacter sp. Hel_I_6 TaxID=1250278 RepID=UPI0005623075|nr:restriction endonuclease subunit S [Salegentibacter sp. Hel_I_6]
MITEKFNDLFDFAKKSKIKAGDGLKEGLYPFYTSSATLSKRINVFQEDRISLIFGTGGQASVHYVDEKFSTSTDCIVANKKEDENLNEKFVYYYLSKNINILERGFKGAGLKHISKKYIQNLDIPILPIETQNEIVAILDKVNALVQKREKTIALLDELLRAQFLEMFGDPVLNPKGWKMKEISNFSESRLGKMLDKKKMLGNNLKKYLGNTNVQWFKFDFSDLKEMDFDEKDQVTFKLNEGDILMCEGGDIGRCAIWKNEMENCFFQKALHRITLDNEVMLPNYFVYNFWLLSNGGGLDMYKGGATISHLTGVNLKKMKLPIPPIEIQNQFETIYHYVQAQKESLIQSKTELEHLYNSLLQEAFKEEIEVSKEEPKKKDSLMSEIKKKDGEKVDITKLDLATYLGIPDEITSTQEKWMFDLISLDEFYQFLLKDTFKKEETFTLGDIEEKLHNFFYHGGDMDFPNASWQQIIFKFLEATPPLLEQIFEEETATVKLKLTDETFKA